MNDLLLHFKFDALAGLVTSIFYFFEILEDEIPLGFEVVAHDFANSRDSLQNMLEECEKSGRVTSDVCSRQTRSQREHITMNFHYCYCSRGDLQNYRITQAQKGNSCVSRLISTQIV